MLSAAEEICFTKPSISLPLAVVASPLQLATDAARLMLVGPFLAAPFLIPFELPLVKFPLRDCGAGEAMDGVGDC